MYVVLSACNGIAIFSFVHRFAFHSAAFELSDRAVQLRQPNEQYNQTVITLLSVGEAAFYLVVQYTRGYQFLIIINFIHHC